MLLTFVKALSRKSMTGAIAPSKKVVSQQVSEQETAQADSSSLHVSRSPQRERAERELKAWPYFYLQPHP
jgi:hypothetical protein